MGILHRVDSADQAVDQAVDPADDHATHPAIEDRGGRSYLRRLCRWLGVALVVAGVWLSLTGWHDLGATRYVVGLCVGALGVVLSLFVFLRRPAWLAPALGVAVVAVVVVVGVAVPQQALADEFTGTGAGWTIASPGESIEARVRDVLVLAGESGARMVRITDGHQLATLHGNRGSLFQVAGDDLLVVTDGTAQLYDRNGRPEWPQGIPADRGVAAHSGYLVLEQCASTCVITGYDGAGAARWHRDRPRYDRYREIHSAQLLPVASTDQYDHVLPWYVAVSSASDSATALDAPVKVDVLDPRSGQELVSGASTATGYATVKDSLVMVAREDGKCVVTMSWVGVPPSSRTVSCTSSRGVIDADVLLLPGNARLDLVDWRKDPYHVGGTLFADRRGGTDAIGERANAEVKGSVVTNEDWWFTAESDHLSLYLGDATTVVAAVVRQGNPFDATPTDRRLTVLAQRDGHPTAEWRVHSLSDVWPAGEGCAFVVADRQVRELGTCDVGLL